MRLDQRLPFLPMSADSTPSAFPCKSGPGQAVASTCPYHSVPWGRHFDSSPGQQRPPWSLVFVLKKRGSEMSGEGTGPVGVPLSAIKKVTESTHVCQDIKMNKGRVLLLRTPESIGGQSNRWNKCVWSLSKFQCPVRSRQSKFCHMQVRDVPGRLSRGGGDTCAGP